MCAVEGRRVCAVEGRRVCVLWRVGGCVCCGG